MYEVIGIRGATYFLEVAEWLFGALLFAGFWKKKLGILGALGSCFSFIATNTIIPPITARPRGGSRGRCFDQTGERDASNFAFPVGSRVLFTGPYGVFDRPQFVSVRL